MPLTQDQFAANVSFSLLLQGTPLSGKTNIAFQFPDPYFLDCDDKLLNAVSRFPGKRFWYDCPMRKPDGKGGFVSVAEEKRYDYAMQCLKEGVALPEVKTVVVDSVTSLSSMMIQHILQFPSTATKKLMVGGIPVMDQSMWGPYRDFWTRMIMGLRGTGKNVIFIAHDISDKDEVTGSYSYRPSFSGQLRDTGAGLFTDVWHTESKLVPDTTRPGQMKSVYYVRTTPTGMIALGNSLGLPSEFIFSWPEFEKYFTKFKASVKPLPPTMQAPVSPT